MTTVRELLTKWVFQADTSKVSTFEKAINGAKRSVSFAAKGLGIMTAASAGAAVGLFKLTEKIAEHADEIGKAASRTGVGVELLQQLKAAASKTEVAFNPLVKGLRSFALATNKAAHGNKAARASFGELGMSVKDAHGKLRPTDDLVQEAIFRLADLDDQNKRLAISTKLFGGRAAELQPLFEDGGLALASMMDEAKKAGKVLDGPVLEAGDRMDRQLRALRGTVGYLKSQLGSALMPVMSELINKINTWVSANKPLIRQKLAEVAEKLAAAFRRLLAAAEKGDLFGKLTRALGMIATVMSAIIKHSDLVITALLAMGGAKILVGLFGVGKALGSILGTMRSMAKVGPSVGGMMGGGLGGKLGALGLVGAAGAGGYAAGTWLDQKFGLSDKISDKLASLHRESKESISTRYNVAGLREQAQTYADMIRRGVTEVQIDGGRMALTRENISGRLSAQASRLGMSGAEQAALLPSLLDKAGITNNTTINVSVPPGSKASEAQRTADAVKRVIEKQNRSTLPGVAK